MMQYDIALSFADEDRDYVGRVADSLKARAVRVFYDRHHESTLWGKDFLDHFDMVYRKAARFFCVIFISQAYERKLWTNYERKSAQERAFRESSEYILPARFDNTEIPGLRSTVGYIDLRMTTPERLADLICEKIQEARFESPSSDRPTGFRWFPDSQATLGRASASIRTFQHLPISFRTEPLTKVVSKIVSRIVGSAQQSPEGAYWTHYQERRFDRIYATSSMLTALCQLGADRRHPLIDQAISYLKRTSPESIDDRAATIFLLLIDELPNHSLSNFLRTLSSHQFVNHSDPAIEGSFLLPQGPSDVANDTGSHWSPRYHSDGASFHACHIADALLHISGSLSDYRVQAEPILTRIREFLIRSFTTHEGWLVDLNGRSTPLTLFCYALCPALHIPLPRDWRTIGAECMRLSSLRTDRTLSRFFGIMNAANAAGSIVDSDFTDTASDFVRAQLVNLPSDRDLDQLQRPDLAGLLRSVAYGVNLLDTRFGSAMTVATNEALDSWAVKDY